MSVKTGIANALRLRGGERFFNPKDAEEMRQRIVESEAEISRIEAELTFIQNGTSPQVLAEEEELELDPDVESAISGAAPADGPMAEALRKAGLI